jgi:hypothetical protein
MSPTPHTLVIGGGLAGLAAATYLARGGARVSLLEKSALAGGRASTDTPNGFALNRGAHALYTGGAASSVLSELGVGYTAGTPRNYLARDERGLFPFPATALDLLRTGLLDAAEKAELMGVLVRVGTLSSAALAHTPAATWIAENTRRPECARLSNRLRGCRCTPPPWTWPAPTCSSSASSKASSTPSTTSTVAGNRWSALSSTSLARAASRFRAVRASPRSRSMTDGRPV